MLLLNHVYVTPERTLLFEWEIRFYASPPVCDSPAAGAEAVWGLLQASRPSPVLPGPAEAVHPGQEQERHGALSQATAQIGGRDGGRGPSVGDGGIDTGWTRNVGRGCWWDFCGCLKKYWTLKKLFYVTLAPPAGQMVLVFVFCPSQFESKSFKGIDRTVKEHHYYNVLPMDFQQISTWLTV